MSSRRASRNVQPRHHRAGACLVLSLVILRTVLPAAAQVNSWLKPSSGNWEEMQWSLGVLPGAGQDIVITNAGWKAVAIGPGTQNFPDALSVRSITLSSPVDSFNTLLLNHPGQAVPLTTRFFTVASNAAVVMLDAGLNLNGGAGEGLSVGGRFDQDLSSTVIGSQLDVGYIGPGVYNLLSGTVWLQQIWIGGAYGGRMNQLGGTNAAAIVHLADGGAYDLLDGDFGANVYFESGLLRQEGGRISAGLGIYRGTYRLEGGVISGGVLVPIGDGYSLAGGSGLMIQTGGTNAGDLMVGYAGGSGSYYLSNGVSSASTLVVGARGTVQQWGGSQTVDGTVSTLTDYVARQVFGYGSYTLNGGTLSAGALNIGGHYTQNGGTNRVAGDVRLAGVYADLQLNGGELRSANTAILDAWVGGYTQSGGRHVIANQLTIGAEYLSGWRGYVMSGGELVVSNITLSAGAKLTKTGGVVAQSGLFTLTAADLYLGEGRHQFGAMSLQSGPATQTNATIHLPKAAPCLLAFGDSRAISWSDTAVLILVDWNGSWVGGGNQQVVFGTGAEALSAAQLSRIWFQDPAGLTPGRYGARILPSGEIVPDALPPTGHVPPVLSLSPQMDGAMQITVRGEVGANYAIDASSNLIHWITWTNLATPYGIGATTDEQAAQQPFRFYRAVLRP